MGGAGTDPDHIAELFASFGPMNVRRMFSGAGVFADGLMIALVVDGVVYFKADDRTIADFKREGRTPFSIAEPGRHANAAFVLADAGTTLRRTR